MRTTLQIPDDLLSQAIRMAQAKTKTEVIIRALEEFVRQRKIEKLIASAGKIHFRKGYDWEKARHDR